MNFKAKYYRLLKNYTFDPSDPSYWARKFTNLLLDLRAIEHGADVSTKSIQQFIINEGLHEDADFTQFEDMFSKVFSVYITSRLTDMLNMDQQVTSELIKAEITRKFSKEPSKQDFLAKVFPLKPPPSENNNQ